MDNPPLVLLIDDDPNFVEIFSTKLQASGFRIETAENGEQGIQKAKKLCPNLVLMDVQMPGLNGVETLIKMKEIPKCEDIPVLFLTALGDPRAEVQEINRRLSKEVGAVGYLKKADDLDVMVDYIRHFLK